MRIRRLATVGVVAALALSGCGTGGSTTPETDTSTTTGADTAPAGEGITLWLAGEDTPDELLTWLTDEFASTTGSTLTIEQVAWGELLPRLQTSLSNPDQTPDVVEVGNTQVATFASVGAFTDLTDHLGDLGGDKLGPQGFIDAATVDGTVYAAPYYWGSRYVFYRTDLLEEAGLEVPTTLEEFNAAAVALTTDEQSGFWLPGQDWRNGISW
ncbi:MAG: extracellular solute-binding protein, partial [Cellulomonadaceae bacterium]